MIKFPIQMYDPTRDYKKHKDEYDNSIQKVLDDGQFINGPQIKELEDKLSEYVGSKYCITISNGTDALKVALLSLNIGLNDEVITVAHTWISTAEVIALIGAKPVFIDIEDKTFNMDINKIEEKINNKTKAILVVSLYGHMPDYEKFYSLSNKYKIALIEDGAQSFGSKRDDYKSCSCKYTTIATTSFFPSKPLGAIGDGGACFTNDDNLAIKIKSIKNHGCIERFNHKYIGLNARLDTLQASILLIKLKYLNNSLIKRNLVANFYSNYLNKIEENGIIKLPKTQKNNFHVWAQYSIILKNKNIRNKIFEYLKIKKINISIFYPSPLHLQECFYYLNYKKNDLPVTENVCDRIINLPCYPELIEDELIYICNTFIDACNLNNLD